MKFRSILNAVLISSSLGLFVACSEHKEGEVNQENKEEITKMINDFDQLATKIETEMKVVYRNLALSYFEAAVSGKQEDYKRAEDFENEYNKLVANKEYFAELKKFKESGMVTDSLQARRLEMLYNAFLGNQIDIIKLQETTALQSKITEMYSTFRAEVNGKKLDDNQIESTLRESIDNKELEATWKASKELGNVVAKDIISLVKLRNETAKSLGFRNYHEMSLTLSDQDPKDIEQIFDELDKLTRDEYKSLKNDIDTYLSKRLNIKPEELMPWHYQNRFFQEAPQIYDLNLDRYYEGQDLVKLTEDYYASIGMPIDDMVAKSDLFAKEGKNQHAFCTDIDRDNGDIRILCNVVDNSGWMNTMLHEYGHGVYFKYHDQTLPWTLKTPAHTFTTEAIAMLFGRMSSNSDWMKNMLGISKKEASKLAPEGFKILKLEQLVFSRWAQVMYRFEKELYNNPDQDLNQLWWDIVEKYQMIKKPEGRDMPDWATKTHIATSPCYYHNYLLGELLASQLDHYIKVNILKQKYADPASYYGNAEVGQYLKDKVFGPGAKYYWNDMIEKATGEKLTAKYYAEQFISSK